MSRAYKKKHKARLKKFLEENPEARRIRNLIKSGKLPRYVLLMDRRPKAVIVREKGKAEPTTKLTGFHRRAVVGLASAWRMLLDRARGEQ